MSKSVQQLKYAFLSFFKAVFQTYYWIISLVIPTNADKFIFVVSRSGELEGNLKYIHDEIITQKPTAKIHLISPVNKMNLKLFKELFLIAGAKYLILDDYFLPLYLIKPKRNIKVVQLWHAAGAFKKFGYSTVDTKFGPDLSYLKIIPIHSNYTHVYVSSENVVDQYAEAFNMSPDNIYPLGLPRTDLFANPVEIKRTIEYIKKQYYNVDFSKTIILYVPTYRAAKKHRESEMDAEEILETLSAQLDDDKLIFYKPHPYVAKENLEKIKDLKNVIIINKFTVNEWMLVSDAFITDYSSAIFEYALLKKPLAHFVPDLKEYESRRGLYYPIEEISDGAVLTNLDQLILWSNSRSKGSNWNTKRMLEFNFNNLKNTSQIITRHFLSDSKEM